MTLQEKLYAGLILWGVFVAVFLVLSVRGGHPLLAFLAVWLASPIPLYFLRFTLEDSWSSSNFKLSEQSLAFLAGDFIILPLLASFAARGWKKIDKTRKNKLKPRWYMSGWWMIGSFIIGIVVSAGFHYGEIEAYTSAGYELALLSPTKILHDFITYPVMVGGLVCVAVPVVIKRPLGSGLIVMGLAAAWLALVGYDAAAGLSPGYFHPKWDPTDFTVVN